MPDYARKMCEACRGRHRTYASTKRAKRKMEKAALRAQRGQTVAWMPLDGALDGAQVSEGPRLMTEVSSSFYGYIFSMRDHEVSSGIETNPLLCVLLIVNVSA